MKKHVSMLLCLVLCFATVLSSCGDNHKIDIDDISWEIKMGINYLEDSVAVVEYTNNTQYTITNISLSFSLKSNNSESDLNEYYAYLAKEYKFSDEDLQKIKDDGITMKSSLDLDEGEYFEPGKTIEDTINYGYTFIYTTEYCDLFEPNMFKITYIDENGLECRVYYDYINDAYTEK